MNQHILLKNVSDIDLDKHGLIEASAGTGKTYTIENMVIRILLEKKIPLKNILIVTYTEKATGELKIRIRSKLEFEIQNQKDPVLKKILYDSLNNFEEAAIHTIHGFCNKVLSDYSFENALPFDFELVDDVSLFDDLLSVHQQKDWYQLFGTNFQTLLEMSDYGDSLLRKIKKVALKWQNREDYKLLPEIKTDDIEEGFKAIENKLITLMELLKAYPISDSFTDWSFCQKFETLSIKKGSLPKLIKEVVHPLWCFMKEANSNQKNLNLFSFYLEHMAKSYASYAKGLIDKLKSPFLLLPTENIWLKKDINYLDTIPELSELNDIALDIFNLVEKLKWTLPIKAIRHLRADSTNFKLENSLLSFDDMLIKLDASLNDSKEGQRLQRKIISDYQYGLVDEFQDTDTFQWSIFKKIFLNELQPEEQKVNSENSYFSDEDDSELKEVNIRKLFLIGDPKQAIYSFRGASIDTYLEAKKIILKLNDENEACLYNLGVNYRSSKSLIKIFNELFSKSIWFNKESGIEYQKVLAPEKIDGNEDKNPMSCVFFDTEEGSGAKCYHLYNKFVTEKIIELMAHHKVYNKSKKLQRLKFENICLLLKSWSDFENFRELFLKYNVPFSCKGEELFQSNETLELCILLKAIENPDDLSWRSKLLLTSFFDIPLQELSKYTELEMDHPIVLLLHKWKTYANNREWSKLYSSVMNETGIQVRLVFDVEGDRKLSNLNQLIDFLIKESIINNKDIGAQIKLLDMYRLKLKTADKKIKDLKTESEDSKVQIMTIHASKGLEFPVVFIAGGFKGRPLQDDFYKVQLDGQTIIDLEKTKEIKKRQLLEEAEEAKRLYYVALTRASTKLYVPLGGNKKDAPLATFVKTAVEESEFDNQPYVEVIKASEYSVNLNALKVKNKIQDGEKSASINIESDSKDQFPELIYEKEEVNLLNKTIPIQSFSSMNRLHSVSLNDDEILESDFLLKLDDANEIPEDLLNLKIDDQQLLLTPGANSGNFIHDLFENINFSRVYDLWKKGLNWKSLEDVDEFKALIVEKMALYDIHDSAFEITCKIIWFTLTKEIPQIGNGFVLCQLNQKDKIHELEFLFPYPKKKDDHNSFTFELKDGYIKGFVDLIFRYQNKYYILDWKSNYSNDSYGPESLENMMTEHDYHYQYEIYMVALYRWLRGRIGPDFKWKMNFGGILYFFVRAYESLDKEEGVYFKSQNELPNPPEIENKIFDKIYI